MAAEHWKWETWNPVTGCTKFSDGCKFCYAFDISERLKANGIAKFKNGFIPTLHPEILDLPFHWKKKRMVFVTSMSDLFHEKIPDDFIFQVFNTMNNNPNHIFSLLTKRAERLHLLNDQIKWTPNIWMGVTVENSSVVFRIELLKKTNARIKYLSCEPLLGSLKDMDLAGIDWLRVGEETGKTPRMMKQEWVDEIEKLCVKHQVTFSLKNKFELTNRLDSCFVNGKKYNEEMQFSLFT